MSNPKESASTRNPPPKAERSSQQEAAQPTVYQAEYHPDEENRIPRSYLIEFHPGHTIAKHFAFLGREFDLTALDQGYFAEDVVDDDLFNLIRRDPGVKYIEDDCLGVPVGEGEICESLGSESATISFFEASCHPYEQERVPEIYLVAIYPGYTIAKHPPLLIRKFELTSTNEGYPADMNNRLFDDIELLGAMRRAPVVRFSEDDVSGERDGDDQSMPTTVKGESVQAAAVRSTQ
ncbi:hypothetical protein LTR37_015058 [Vermiconidia calcicola]|uniref:Uncharacterized protein n=1 Tax=Vermiconidia calcicola TaxID=1690605 RepID=A0ACC3MTH5_9PEZI|nr:hypothetical protein LTR37_015058 [Vermiconidia calcicola]